MGEARFISQQQLEGLLERGDASFEKGVLTMMAEALSHPVAPALRVLSLAAGQDVQGLLGKVLVATELQGLGAEHYHDSLIVGDAAYQCEEGFVIVAATKAQSDSELLADFLLKNP